MGFTNYIQQIKDTAGTTHDLVDTSASHYIKGTQTASTNVWTGALPDGVTAYYDGLAIDYFLPFAGTSTAATLNLGSKGAKPVYRGNAPTSGVTTHFPALSVIHMTYVINSSINSGNGAWIASAYYDSNSNDTCTGYQRFSHGTYITTTAVGRYVICLSKTTTSVVPVTAVNNSTATTKALTTDTFNPFEPIYYYSNNGSTTQTAANTALSVSYLWTAYSNINLSYSFNTGSTLTTNKDVFIKATPTSGYMATLASTPIVQDLPTSDDGFIYIKLGHANSTSNIAMAYEHPIYWYKNGAVRKYGGDAATLNGDGFKLGYTTSGNNRAVQADSNGKLYVTQKDDNTNTWRNIQVNGTEILGTGTGTGALNLKAGSNMSVTNSNGTVTFAATDTNNHQVDISAIGTSATFYYPTMHTDTSGTNTALKGSDCFRFGTEGTEGKKHKLIIGKAQSGESSTLYLFKDSNSVALAPSASTSQALAFYLPTTGGTLALADHTHTTSLASGGTSTVNLSANTTYTLTAGGTSVIFKTPADSDTKVSTAAVTSGTTYYPIVGTGTTAATRQFDTTGFVYKGTNGTTSAVGSAILTLGNSTASGTANNKQGQLILYGSTAYATTITPGAPTAARTITLPNASGTVSLDGHTHVVSLNNGQLTSTYKFFIIEYQDRYAWGTRNTCVMPNITDTMTFSYITQIPDYGAHYFVTFEASITSNTLTLANATGTWVVSGGVGSYESATPPSIVAIWGVK